MSFKINKMIELSEALDFWGVGDFKLPDNLSLLEIKQEGSNKGKLFIDEATYLTIKPDLQKLSSLEIYDKSNLRRKAKKLGVSNDVAIDFSSRYKPLIEPFTEKRYMESDIGDAFHNYVSDTTYTISKLAETYGLEPATIYTIAKVSNLPLWNTNEMPLSTYATLDNFLTKFELVSNKEDLKVVSDLNLPFVNVPKVGVFVERLVASYIRKEYISVQGKQHLVNKNVTINGNEYLMLSYLKDYLETLDVKVSKRTLVENTTLIENAKEINGYQYVSKDKLDEVSKYWKSGFNFSLSVALAYGEINLQWLQEDVINRYQLNEFVHKCEELGLINKSFKKRLVSKTLINVSPVSYIQLFDKKQVEDAFIAHIKGLSPDYSLEDYISVYKLVEFLNEIKGEFTTPQGIELMGGKYYIPSVLKNSDFIWVSATVVITNKRNVSQVLFEAYNNWLLAKTNAKVKQVKELLNAVE